MSKRKVLLMGQSGSGKTSMRSIIFANFLPMQTRQVVPTINYETQPINFLDDLSLNLWDCGGQDLFWENYFLHKDDIFSNVECMIFVFNADSRDSEKEFGYFKRVVAALKELSPNAKIFALVHKIDLVPEERVKTLFQKREAEIRKHSTPLHVQCFATSIWDETLYKAWSEVVNSMIPRRDLLLQHLDHFAKAAEASEVLLFEKATFLVLAATGNHYRDINRFEKLSTLLKQFKLSCNKMQTHFATMEIRNREYHSVIAPLTTNTYVLVVSDPDILTETISLNLMNARPHFTALLSTLRASA